MLFGDAKIVLLGEASHGTSEFYSLRTELTKLLIEQKEFTFMAVEGDWPSSYQINRYIKQYSDAPATPIKEPLEFVGHEEQQQTVYL